MSLTKLYATVSTHISIKFLYTGNKKFKKGIKREIPYTMSLKIIKYLGII